MTEGPWEYLKGCAHDDIAQYQRGCALRRGFYPFTKTEVRRYRKLFGLTRAQAMRKLFWAYAVGERVHVSLWRSHSF